MGYASVRSALLVGVEVVEIQVEVHIGPGLPAVDLVGLPATQVKESKARIRSAIMQSGLSWPLGKITINLVPSDLPKHNIWLDLPIALGVLAADSQISAARLNSFSFMGALQLDGTLLSDARLSSLASRYTCPVVMPPFTARPKKVHTTTEKEAHFIGACNLWELVDALKQNKPLPRYLFPETMLKQHHALACFTSIKGHEQPKQALLAAASGAHHLLMSGPPGSGKTMLAESLHALMPIPTQEQLTENALIQSLATSEPKSLPSANLWHAPHHRISKSALLGGYSPCRPGVISQASHGLLFLDELPEFSGELLESLREVLDHKTIMLNQRGEQLLFPASFQLVAAMNPCSCGYLGHPEIPCRCTPTQLRRYQSRLSGPFLSRIDMMIEVPHIPPHLLRQQESNVSLPAIAQIIKACRNRQYERQGHLNGHQSSKDYEKATVLDQDNQMLMIQIASRYKLGTRSILKLKGVARTLADLDDSPRIERPHLLEAASWRTLPHLGKQP